MLNSILFVSRRLHFNLRLPFISIIVSFLVMILSISISSGFRKDIREDISDLSADIQISDYSNSLLDDSRSLIYDSTLVDIVSKYKNICNIEPVVYKTAILKMKDNIYGLLFKSAPFIQEKDAVAIPKFLADNLNLKKGDYILTYFMSDKMSVRKFKVDSIFSSVFVNSDNPIVFANVSSLQSLNKWDTSQFSALELRAEYEDIQELENISLSISEDLVENDATANLFAQTSYRRFYSLFSWLDLIDMNVNFLLVLMILVAGFNMISGLLIFLFRNISNIGLLKSMGMSDWHISLIFLRLASKLIFRAMMLANAFALMFCFFQDKYHFLKLNPENYFLSYVPVHLDIINIICLDISAYIIILLSLLLPCLFILRIDPAKTLRLK